MSKLNKRNSNIKSLKSKEPIYKYIKIVNKEYCLVDYGTSNTKYSLVMRVSDKKVNISQLCIDAGKQLKHWLKMDESQEYINCLMKKLHLNYISELIDDICTDGPSPVRGFYAHEYLVPNITQWCSPEFALDVSIVMNNHIIKAYNNEVRRRFIESDKQLSKNRKILAENCKILSQNDKKLSHNGKSLDLLIAYYENILLQTDILLEDNKKMKNKLHAMQ